MDHALPIEPAELFGQVFPNLADPAIDEMAAFAALRTYPSGTVLCRQGAIENTFYIVSAGRVEVLHELEGGQERPLRTVGPGGFFGELAIIMDAPRAATVRTIEHTTVVELDKSAFVRLLGKDPSVGLTIMRTVLEWLRANEQRDIAELEAKTGQAEAAYTALAQREAQRQAFLTTLAGGLLAPLHAAKAELDRLNRQPAEALTRARLGQDISELQHNVDAIIQQVNDLLFVQSLEPIQAPRRRLALSQLLREVVEEERPHATEKRLQIAAAIAPDLPTVEGDEDGLARAFRALLDNAIKFSPVGGVVLMTARKDKGHIELTFADSGAGIPASDLDRIFEPFALPGGHVGLGLAIARYWIRYHNGTINLRSQAGQGTTFTVRLPAAQG